MRHRLPKSERLRSHFLIERLFQPTTNASLAAYPVRIVYRTAEQPDKGAYRGNDGNAILISVPKRLFKHAVDRNRVKRQIREAYRNNRELIKTPDGKQVCVCTDLGTVTNEVDMHLSGSDLVLLESNYDESMLKNGPYPYELKRRIASDHGHLSNSACGEQLKKLMTAGTYKFILGHLSQENNTPLQAENSAVGALGDYERNSDYILHIAKPEGSGMAVAV